MLCFVTVKDYFVQGYITRVTEGDPNESAEAGRAKVLTCDIDKTRDVRKITWYFNRKLIKQSDKYYLFNSGLSMEIEDLQKYDKGLYSCTVNDMTLKDEDNIGFNMTVKCKLSVYNQTLRKSHCFVFFTS